MGYTPPPPEIRFTLETAERLAKIYRAGSGAVSFTNGCFDILHIGHVRMLQSCRRMTHRNGILIVAVNSDKALKALKIRNPFVHEIFRAEIVRSLMGVGHVFILDAINVVECIHRIKPTVWFKGGDYTIETLNRDEVAAAEKENTQIKILPLEEHMSTSKIVEDIRNSGAMQKSMR